MAFLFYYKGDIIMTTLTNKTDLHFCYRVAAEAALAIDKDGNDTSMLSEIKLGQADVISEECYKQEHENLRFRIADMLNVSPDLVEKISYEEYLLSSDDEDDEE